MAQGLVAAGSRITPTILNRMWEYGDATSHTVTATSFTDLSTVYTVAAGNPEVGDGYQLTVWGTGTWGSTQQALSFAIALGGTAGNAVTIASAAFSASAAFDWYVRARILCSTAGSSGAYVTMLEGCVTETANSLLPGTAADNTVPFTRVQASVSQNTANSMTMSVQAKWASATGTPTLSAAATAFGKYTQQIS